MSEAHGARQEHGGFNLSAWALTHKPLMGFLMVIALLAGVRAYNGLGRDEDPPFTIKTMVVRAFWPGADAIQTAKQLTDRLEKPLESLEYLDFVDDVLDELDSRKEVEYVRTMLDQGCGAERQLEVFEKTGDLKKVVEYMVAETAAGL